MFETSSCVITFGAFLDFVGFFDDLRGLSAFVCSASWKNDLKKNDTLLKTFRRSLVSAWVLRSCSVTSVTGVPFLQYPAMQLTTVSFPNYYDLDTRIYTTIYTNEAM